MKLLSTKKFKTLLLAGTLSLSLFFGGCSDNQNLDKIFNSATTATNDVKADPFSVVPKDATQATLNRVVDGDTMKLKLENSNEVVTLRLLLVDTPESVKSGVDPQPYSQDASNFAKKSLKEGDTVYIEYDSGSKTDKYGRHLGYLWYYSEENNSWEMFNEIIVEKGLARVGYIYSQKKHLDILYSAQDKAKASKLNIWSVTGYVTDKGFDVEAYNKNSSNKTNENTSSKTVYANGSASSKKYHSSEHAHNMKKSIKMTESEATSEGYEPCQICY